MSSSKGYAAQDKTAPLAPFNFERRNPLPTDIAVEILYCGVCPSDLHMAPTNPGNLIFRLYHQRHA